MSTRLPLALALLALGCGDGSVGALGLGHASGALCSTDTYEEATGQRAPAQPDPNLLHWHCGAVLGPSHVVPVFWGSSWKTTHRAWADGLTGFLGAFGSSHYAELASEFRGNDESDNIIVASPSVTAQTPIFDDAPFPSADTSISDAQTGAEVCRLTDNAPDPSTIYVVYDERGPTGDACARHHGTYRCQPDDSLGVLTASIFNVGAADIFCPVPDDPVHPGAIARLANATAHEVMESITNPRMGGWYDDGGTDPSEPSLQVITESADKCQGLFEHPVTLTDGSQWWLQAEWSNRAYREDAGVSEAVGCLQE